MSDETPKKIDHKLYELIREDKIDDFNKRWDKGERCDMTGLNFRGQDMRKINQGGIDFSNCYFRQADLRGLNMSTWLLEGASIYEANISGAYFPKELSTEEILLSISRGTRMRYNR